MEPLTVEVQLYLTQSGRLHAGSLYPAEVGFAGAGDLFYDVSRRHLILGDCTYERSIAQRWQLCAYDTVWVATDADAARKLGLPSELSVHNNEGRVAVFIGPRPGYTSEMRARAGDLIAHCANTDGNIPEDFSCDREFFLRLEPTLEERVSATPGALALILAICSEGFWAHGGICHGGLDDFTADSHGGAVDETALLRGIARGGSTIVRPRKSLWKGYERNVKKRMKEAAKEKERAAVKLNGALSATRAPLDPIDGGRI